MKLFSLRQKRDFKVIFIIQCNLTYSNLNGIHERMILSDPPFIEWHVRCTFETCISVLFLKQEMHESLL